MEKAIITPVNEQRKRFILLNIRYGTGAAARILSSLENILPNAGTIVSDFCNSSSHYTNNAIVFYMEAGIFLTSIGPYRTSFDRYIRYYIKIR